MEKSCLTMGYKVEVVYKCGHPAVRDLPFQSVYSSGVFDNQTIVQQESALTILKRICEHNLCMDCEITKRTK